ncbi:MAG: GNAT family N-acetyltransferase [Bacteroidales bacterium]|nr:GNAT family N-acetyltransferase [Bacteroidales bacterium]
MYEVKKSDISTYQRIRDKFRYGLVLQSIRNQLAKLGFNVRLYYFVMEGLFDLETPSIKGDIEKTEIGFLTLDDMNIVGKYFRGYPAEEIMEWLDRGKMCLGLRYDKNIVAFMWINFKECTFDIKKIYLKEDECYLSDMYTVESYRGRNFAALLRHKSYKILKEMGRVKIYSITEYFNKSAARYKQKLKAVNLKLILYVSLFRIIKFSVTLKSYEKNLKLT